ncbi:TPA: metallophosphoesterase, partial [Campylobacter jejuni]|nr:UDP-2,3-diacylglucosamine diphosphatase [Campylobacter jejuni]EAK5869344.1 UDP-2,3-diacylglucosamine diphosphatase [Campylobacter jejuni]HEF8731121.1 metallophosphoesterase [Campylobacter jejuni]
MADAHENEQRKGFWEFLQALKKGKISTPQLILIGDIFDLLIGEISATHEFAKPYIELLEELALKIEIIYLEGNHDFNLSCFFKRVKIFNLQEQPIKLNLHTSKGNNLVLNSAFI